MISLFANSMFEASRMAPPANALVGDWRSTPPARMVLARPPLPHSDRDKDGPTKLKRSA